MQSQSDLSRRFDLGGEDVATIAGKQVVMIGRRGASGEGQARKGGASSVIFEVGVQMAPDGIQRGQPFEQRPVLRIATSNPLVQVVMDVHEAGRRQAPRAVDATRSVDGRRGSITNDVDAPVPDHEVPAGVLLVEVIDRGDRAAVDDQRVRGHADTAGRSAFAWSAWPVTAASRSAGCRRLITNYRQMRPVVRNVSLGFY